jgi:predicted membrane-bound mannosyltransferase
MSDQFPAPQHSHPLERTSAESAKPPAITACVIPIKVEIIAWAALAALALTMRLADLGARPLSDTEAAQALVSWRLYQGLKISSGGYSPLLTTGGLIAFALWGATEFTARLASALSGVFLVLLPLGLRHYLGRLGAICAGMLLCISPSALYLSRTVNGDVVVIAGAA